MHSALAPSMVWLAMAAIGADDTLVPAPPPLILMVRLDGPPAEIPAVVARAGVDHQVQVGALAAVWRILVKGVGHPQAAIGIRDGREGRDIHQVRDGRSRG